MLNVTVENNQTRWCEGEELFRRVGSAVSWLSAGGDGAIFQPLSASLLQIPKGQSLVSVPPLGGWRSGGEGGWRWVGREAVV